MKNKLAKRIIVLALAASMLASLAACGGNKSDNTVGSGEMQEVDVADLSFPLAEKATLTGMTQYPANTESDPNNRTVFVTLLHHTGIHQQLPAVRQCHCIS